MRIFFMAFILLSNFGSTFTWPEGNRNSTVFDMSSSCVNNYQKSVFLPYSMGISDSVTFIISNKYHYRNCSIIFHDNMFETDLVKIIVIEFVNKMNTFESVCNGSNIYLTENIESHQNVTIDVCSMFTLSTFVNPFIFSTTVGLRIEVVDKNRDSFQIVRITGTTSKSISVNNLEIPKDATCQLNETACYWDTNSSCISRELMCDGISNCGRRGLYDEDIIQCQKIVKSELFNMTLLSIGIMLYIMVFVLDKIRKIFPSISKQMRSKRKRRKDTMVFTHRSPIKTYIPVKAVDTLHFRVVSAPSFKLSETEIRPRYKIRKTSIRQ